MITDVPLCPSGLATFLLVRGFPGDSTMLDDAVAWLHSIEVTSGADFVGLGPLLQIEGASSMPSDVLAFLQKLVTVRHVLHYVSCTCALLTFAGCAATSTDLAHGC